MFSFLCNVIKFILVVSFILSTSFLFAQTKTEGQDQNPYNLITGGLTIKPIIPSRVFGNGSILLDTAGVNFTIQPQLSYCAGAVIRRSFTKLLAIETGLNFNRRVYDMKVLDTNDALTTIRYRMTGFEIPIKALVFVQLSKQFFATVSLGGSFDIYPSSILVKTEQYRVGGLRSSFLSFAMMANLGLEYRTKESGILYLGAAYHRPFSNIFYNEVAWDLTGRRLLQGSLVGGGYLAIDFRYYLQPTQILKKEAKKKKKTAKK